MTLPQDFREFLQCLNANSVRFVVVGGYAVAHHGYPRFTGDLDVLVEPSPENARNVIAAIEEFAAPVTGLSADDFEKPDTIVQLGLVPLRIDIITSIDGVATLDALTDFVLGEMDGMSVPFISLEKLVQNKRATGRPQDSADLDHLGF